MKVQLYESQVQRDTFKPNIDINPDAFGKNVAQANQKFSAAISDFQDTMDEINYKRQVQKDTQQVLDAQNKFKDELDQLLYNKDNGIISTRTLNNAENATLDFKTKAEEIRKKYLGDLKGQTQKEQFGQLSAENVSSSSGMVIRHEAEQLRQAKIDTLNTNLSQLEADAATNPTLDSVTKIIGDGKAKLQVTGQQFGQDDATIKLNQQLQTDKVVSNAVKTLIDKGDYKAAKAIFDKVRGEMSGKTAEGIELAINNEAQTDEFTAVYNQIGNLKLADGNPDYGKIQKEVSKLYTGEKYEKAWDFIKAKVNEAELIKNKQQDATDRAFTNDVITLKNNGGNMTQALKRVGKYSYDATDRLTKENYVKNLYAVKDRDSDPNVYIALWEGVQTKTVTRRDIDDAFKAGSLTNSDWESLRKDFFKSKIEGVNSEQKQISQYVDLKAKQKFSSKDEKGRAAFKYAMLIQTQGKSLAEATDTVDKAFDTKGQWSAWYTAGIKVGGKKQWQYDLDNFTSRNIELGSIYNVFGGKTSGEEVADEIGKATILLTKRPPQKKDYDQFISMYGAKNLAEGTPVNNAIRSIARLKKANPDLEYQLFATPQTIKAILTQYPDGNVPLTTKVDLR